MLRKPYFQRSVYIKLLRNISSGGRELGWLDSVAPQDGSVQAVVMNLNVFRGLTAIRGKGFNMALFADDAVFLCGDGPEDAPEMEDAELYRRCDELLKKHRPASDETRGDRAEEDGICETDLF